MTDDGRTLGPYTCEQALARLYAYLDRELPLDEAAVVARHIELCEACSWRFEFEARLLKEIRRKGQSSRAPERLRRKVERLIDEL